MSGRAKLLVFGGIAVVGIVVLGGMLLNRGSVGGYLSDTYRQVSASGSSRVYASAAGADVTANQIAGAFSPDDRVSSPEGEFLRYDDVIVGVTAAAAGSQIYLDDRERGYRRWGVFVGPGWRPSVGRGEGFRGGGPGDGK